MIEPIRDRRSAEWLALISRNDSGNPHATLANASVYLQHDPEAAGLLRYNRFADHVSLTRPPPAPWRGAPPSPGPYPRALNDADLNLLQSWLNNRAIRVGVQIVSQAVDIVARANPYHPIQEWLAGLKWDGVSRLDSWLHHAYGAEQSEFHSEIGMRFLVAAVRRIMQPGCKFDSILVLEGPQSLGKSRSIPALFGAEYTADDMPDLRRPDAPMALSGVWCMEISELGALVRAENEIVKAFLSRPVDKFRAPYARTFQIVPRQSVMIGTTNEKDYLRDTTGNRRYWPCLCTRVDIDWITENREQLFAEAYALYQAGTATWLDNDATDTLKELNEERMPEDPWESTVLQYLDGLGRTALYVRVPTIMEEVLMIPAERRNRGTEMRIGNILRRAGWSRKLTYIGAIRIRAWFRPE